MTGDTGCLQVNSGQLAAKKRLGTVAHQTSVSY